MSITTPRLIRDRCDVYYFRLIVPPHWRETVSKAEIRRSLRTKDAATARHAVLLHPRNTGPIVSRLITVCPQGLQICAAAECPWLRELLTDKLSFSFIHVAVVPKKVPTP